MLNYVIDVLCVFGGTQPSRLPGEKNWHKKITATHHPPDNMVYIMENYFWLFLD